MAYGVGGILTAVIVVVLAISLTHGDRKSGHGCIEISLSYSMGGTQNYYCGTKARAMCAGVNKPGLTGTAGRDVAVECRKAGIGVG